MKIKRFLSSAPVGIHGQRRLTCVPYEYKLFSAYQPIRPRVICLAISKKQQEKNGNVVFKYIVVNRILIMGSKFPNGEFTVCKVTAMWLLYIKSLLPGSDIKETVQLARSDVCFLKNNVCIPNFKQLSENK